MIAELRSRQGSLHRAAAQIKDAVDVLHDSSRSALRRFESLPRQKQIMWVAAPYIGAAFLVSLLLALDVQEPPVRISPVAAAPIPKVAIPETAPPPPTPPPAPAPALATFTLPVRATLFARPDGELKIANVRPQTVTLYPDFPAAEGWVLVRTEKGTVGYLEKARLSGEEEPKAEKRKKKRRRH